ncbi:MAG: hypothetical protein PT943_02050 [Ruminococcus sp.]|nr:hypothetical protein [Ruminococcus sp.]
MKNKILISLCSVLAICCIMLSFCLASIKGESESDNDTSKASGTLPAQAAATSSDIQFKLSLLHLYYESQQLVSTLPYATVQITYAALIKAFMTDSSAVSAAVEYLNKYVDKQVMSAYDSMDEILSKYQAVLKKYNISSSSSYNAKYNNLKTVFDSLKNSSVELISRTRSLILVSHSSNYDSSYTLYNEQLADLTSKIQSAVVNITNEYEALLAEISSDYDMIK